MRWAFYAGLLLLAGPLWAAQTSFQREYIGGDVLLSYSWTDRNQEPQALVFRLAKQDVARANKEFQPFDNDAANDAAIAATQDYATHVSRGDHQIEIEPTANGFNVKYRNLSPLVQERYTSQIKQVHEDGLKAYLNAHLYTLYDNSVMPDHRNIARRYAPAMGPVVRALRRQLQGKNQREKINYLLNWLQNIPYDELLNRETSNGAGFQTPFGLLLNNRGDCDTKSVTLAALLRHLYPHNRVMIFYVPGHAFLGFQMTPGPQDLSMKIGNQSFVLLDPTGPFLAWAGEIQPETERYLQQGNYSFQEVPF